MNSSRWFILGGAILSANALAVAWTTLQYRAYADSNSNPSQVSDAEDLEIDVSPVGAHLPGGTQGNDSDPSDVKIEVSPPISEGQSAASDLPLPVIPSLAEPKLPSADALRNDPVFDELTKMFRESPSTRDELMDSARAMDTLSAESGAVFSAAYIESLDRRMEVVEQLAKSTRGMIREASSLAQQGNTEQAKTMLSLAIQIRATMLRFIAELPK